jgi:hypothetical protein
MARTGKKSEQMSDLIKKWRASGATKKAFCATEKVNIHTFTYWIEKERVLTEPTGFVAVLSESRPSYVELLFPQGAVMRLGSDISTAQLSLLKTLLY